MTHVSDRRLGHAPASSQAARHSCYVVWQSAVRPRITQSIECTATGGGGHNVGTHGDQVALAANNHKGHAHVHFKHTSRQVLQRARLQRRNQPHWGEDSSFVAQGNSHATLPMHHYQLHRRHVSAWTRPHATGGVACWRSPGLRVMIWPAACTPQCVHAASLAARGACPAAWRPAAHPTRGSQHPSTAQWRWKHTRDKVRRLNRHETGEGAHTSASVRLPSFGQPGRALPCPAPAPQSPWEGTPAKARVSTGRHVRGPSATTGATGRIALHNTWA